MESPKAEERVEIIYAVEFDPEAKRYVSARRCIGGEETTLEVSTRLDFLETVLQDARTYQPDRVGICHKGAEQALYLHPTTVTQLCQGTLDVADLLIT